MADPRKLHPRYDCKHPWHAMAFICFRRHPLSQIVERHSAGITFKLRAGRITIYAVNGPMLGRGRTIVRAMNNAMLRLELPKAKGGAR